MTDWTGSNYFTELVNIMGFTLNFIFQVPLFDWGSHSVTVGSLILYGSIVYVILRFAVNLPSIGITTERRIRIKRDE